jgi:hypothetical protein
MSEEEYNFIVINGAETLKPRKLADQDEWRERIPFDIETLRWQ